MLGGKSHGSVRTWRTGDLGLGTGGEGGGAAEVASTSPVPSGLMSNEAPIVGQHYPPRSSLCSFPLSIYAVSASLVVRLAVSLSTATTYTAAGPFQTTLARHSLRGE